MQTQTLKENRDFRRVYSRGRSYVHSSLVIYMLKNRLGYNRIGITVGKKTGNAVQRNRAKRIIREAYRHFAGKIGTGYDIVMVARKRTLFMKSYELMNAMSELFEKSGGIRK